MERDRNREEAERLLKELIPGPPKPQTDNIVELKDWRMQLAVHETNIEQLVWHIIVAAARAGRGVIR